MTKALAIRHMYSGSMFNIQTALEEHGIEHKTVEGFSTDLSKIDPLEPDILIVMGGAMGVYEADIYPYLYQEMDILRARIKADKPILGICLGAQLIAGSQGGRNYKGTNGREWGFMNIELNDEGRNSPLKHFDPALTRILQMHSDTFDLPENATLLASSPQYVNQAFRIGKNCFGTQFHCELDHVGFENMMVEDNGKIDVPEQRAEAAKYLPTMEKQTSLFMKDLFKLWGV